jgi:hypothetical protein
MSNTTARSIFPTLRRLMAEKQVRPKDAAFFCRVSASAVSLWRGGQKRPHGYHFDRLCLLLSCTSEELERALEATRLERAGNGQAPTPAADR